MLAIWATPGASRSEITGVADGWVRVRLRAPAREGKANAELARLLAAKLGVQAGDVRLTAGMHGRRKTVHVRGVDVVTARARLES